MTVSALISCGNTVVNNGQLVPMSITLTNPPGAAAVNVVSITPFLNGGTPGATAGMSGYAGPAIGAPVLLSPTASASASLTFSWFAQAYAPPAPQTLPDGQGYMAPGTLYTAGALVTFSDASTATASTTFFVYPIQKDATLALTSMPGNGSLRFDSNIESALIGAVSFPH